MLADNLHDLLLHRLGDAVALACVLQQNLRAEIAGQDDDDIAEVHRPSLAVRKPTVVKHLQQHVEDLDVGLLDLLY